METLKSLQKKFKNAGYVADFITVHNVGGTGADVPALKINTEYDGPYPTEAVFGDVAMIRKIAKNHRTECRGHYTAILIY